MGANTSSVGANDGSGINAALLAEFKKKVDAETFEDLCQPGSGCHIDRTEERGITVNQLLGLVEHVRRRCVVEGWVNRSGMSISWNRASLYDVVEWVIKPLTARKSRSYVEAVACGPQVPRWFVSHWYGQSVADFVKCLNVHSDDRDLGRDAPYWACAYASLQGEHTGDEDWVGEYAKNQWDRPEDSPFQRAMRLAEGTLSVIDPEATCFKRIWCVYEIWTGVLLATPSLEQVLATYHSEASANRYLYDIYSAYGDRVVGLTDGFAPVDMRRARCWWATDKTLRESKFPVSLATDALSLRLEDAEASHISDKKHILNTIAGSTNLDVAPPVQHELYESLNKALRGRFAAAVWRQALEAGYPMEHCSSTLADSGLWKLELSFDGAEKSFTDAAAGHLARGFSHHLRELIIDLTGCRQLTDAGLQVLADALPCSSLVKLEIDFSRCRSITDAGVASLGQALQRAGGRDEYGGWIDTTSEMSSQIGSHAKSTASTACSPGETDSGACVMQGALLHLALIFCGCPSIDDSGLSAVVRSIPASLRHLEFNCFGNSNLCCPTLEAVASALRSIPSLRHLDLRFGRCPSIGNAAICSVARSLPPTLTYLALDFRFNQNLNDSFAQTLVKHLPEELAFLQLDLIGCHLTTVITDSIVTALREARSGLEVSYLGRDTHQDWCM
eukprot:TRINITY_DN40654_c0_g1_i2.p1 TRINITY_DN40654_c0_g1~~TRINITY_DN40654_c0_g1_i2.p1  ORF type:complete len:674 (-),score=83.65 TRINITY_DN40654_c0_g1_i2:69-2090(-)